jgi:hypothetical protein
MLTEWGAKLTPQTAWQEYPRPALARGAWTNLNGLWQYQVAPAAHAAAPAEWAGDILAPFAIESALSGVKKRVSEPPTSPYTNVHIRSFRIPRFPEKSRDVSRRLPPQSNCVNSRENQQF